MIPLTTEEEHALSEALWKAAEGIKETREILAGIGDRLGLKWQGTTNHIRDMAGFVAVNMQLRSQSDHVAKGFAEDHYWRK